MTAISGAMPADLAEAVRSMPCGACQAPRGGHCAGEGTHLARWELATASALVSPQEYLAAAGAARSAPPGFPPGLAVVPELSGVVCTAAGHPLQWAARVQPPQWVDPGSVGRAVLCRAGRAAPGHRGTVPLPPPALVTEHSGGDGGGRGALPAVRPQARPPGAEALRTGPEARVSGPCQPGLRQPGLRQPGCVSRWSARDLVSRAGHADRDRRAAPGRNQAGSTIRPRPRGGQAETVPDGGQAPGPHVADPAERELGGDPVPVAGQGRGPLPGSWSARPAGPAARPTPAGRPRPGRTARRAARAGLRPPPRRPRLRRRRAAGPASSRRPWP